MTRDQIQLWLSEHGWKADKFGHYKKEVEVTNKVSGEKLKVQYRCKMQSISMRVERKSGDEWFKRFSEYYKAVHEVETGLKVGAGILRGDV